MFIIGIISILIVMHAVCYLILSECDENKMTEGPYVQIK